MLAAGDFLIHQGLWRRTFMRMYAGIVFEWYVCGEHLHGTQCSSQVRLLAGDRKEGETAGGVCYASCAYTLSLTPV